MKLVVACSKSCCSKILETLRGGSYSQVITFSIEKQRYYSYYVYVGVRNLKMANLYSTFLNPCLCLTHNVWGFKLPLFKL